MSARSKYFYRPMNRLSGRLLGVSAAIPAVRAALASGNDVADISVLYRTIEIRDGDDPAGGLLAGQIDGT